MGKYLDLIKRTEGYAVNAVDAVRQPKNEINNQSDTLSRIRRLPRTLSTLETRCPSHVHVARWQQCVEDGRAFLATWGEQAEALGWTARDLFGLFSVPEHMHPSFSRLSRYDHTGLIWLLQGKPVIALTEATAAIQSPTGAVTIYRKHNKPGLGPVGDSLGDFAPPFGGDAA
jgi:hypothetical protein